MAGANKQDPELESFAIAYALAGNTIGRKTENGGNGNGYNDSGVCYTLTKTDVHAIAQALVFQKNSRLTSQVKIKNLRVRRLTPTECARLQGFSDDHLSQVPRYSDTKAYRALGNSMAVNVMQLIGEKIQIALNPQRSE